MKRKWDVITEAAKIVANCLLIALCFIKIFHDEALLPGYDANGNQSVIRSDYYYSIYDKFLREGYLYLLWLTVVLLIVSVVISVVCMLVKSNVINNESNSLNGAGDNLKKKALTIASHAVFGLAVVMFIVSLLLSASIVYGY